jgi:hypothetical protein
MQMKNGWPQGLIREERKNEENSLSFTRNRNGFCDLPGGGMGMSNAGTGGRLRFAVPAGGRSSLSRCHLLQISSQIRKPRIGLILNF